MTNRLELIYSLIETTSLGVADIGTDHGYLPVALAERGFKGNIIASDINAGPLMLAQKNAEVSRVSELIDFHLTNGLNGIPVDKIDTIVIAGMGGDTICSILDDIESSLFNGKKLILQPMSKQEILRYWLVNNGFKITSDEYVEDNCRIFSIINACRSDTPQIISDIELYIGKYSLCNNKELLYRYLKRQKKIFSDILIELTSEKSKVEFLKIYISSLIKDITSLLEKDYGEQK